MSIQNSLVSSLRENLAGYLAERARRREIAALFADPDLQPSARQEIETIMMVGEAAPQSTVRVPAQRRVSAAAPAATSR